MKPIAFPLELTPRGHFVDANGHVLHVAAVLAWANAAQKRLETMKWIEDEWDPQAVAVALDMKPGDHIRREILPRVEALKAERDHFKRRSE